MEKYRIQIEELNNGEKRYIPQVGTTKLSNGSLFIMEAGMQSTHKHRIPKSDKICEPRISLTFRVWKK
jgi:hypothetical protein